MTADEFAFRALLVHRLWRARKRAGISQGAIAARIGRGQRLVSQIEAGACDITLGTLFSICEALELERQLLLAPPDYDADDRHAQHETTLGYGVQLGHRFRALKLWMVIRAFGTEGLAERIRAHCAMAREFASWVDADPEWKRLAPVPMSVVCFRWAPPDGRPAPRARGWGAAMRPSRSPWLHVVAELATVIPSPRFAWATSTRTNVSPHVAAPRQSQPHEFESGLPPEIWLGRARVSERSSARQVSPTGGHFRVRDHTAARPAENARSDGV